jgi:hypothetical protein
MCDLEQATLLLFADQAECCHLHILVSDGSDIILIVCRIISMVGFA